MITLILRKGLLLVCLFLMSSCYRMPTEDDYSLVPCTNNRDLTGEKSSIMPGMSY